MNCSGFCGFLWLTGHSSCQKEGKTILVRIDIQVLSQL